MIVSPWKRAFQVGAACALAVLLTAADQPEAANRQPAEAARRESAEVAAALSDAWPDRPEWVDMLADILEKNPLEPGDGWFRTAVAQKRYDWKSTCKRLDLNRDGVIERKEIAVAPTDFTRLDRDHDGRLTAADFDFSANITAPAAGTIVFMRADRDGDGKVSREELNAFFREADSGDQGFLSQSDLQSALPQPARTQPGSGAASKATLIRSLFRQELGSLLPGPKLDESAPDFTLRTVDGKDELTLSKLVGPKPVVLVFGNFTCSPFRGQAGNIEKLYRLYRDRATFVMVYVREAHPTDGWSAPSNERAGIRLRQPRSYEERVGVAQKCSRTLRLGMPMLVDTIDDKVGATFSGMPSRLYLIDREGKVAYKSGRGPFGFKPDELEQSLILLLEQRTRPVGERQAGARPARFPLLNQADAWRHLPKPKEGDRQALPNWALGLARTLPQTTAAMLDLDRLHRTRSPLGPELRGKIRWVAAQANKCDYSRAYAEADLRRAGVTDQAIQALAGDRYDLPESEQSALAFARQMTLEADKVTDAEVERVKSAFGEKKLAAMVLLLAYANFQDRLLLALDVPIEPFGPLPPLEVRFEKGAGASPVPARAPQSARLLPPVPEKVDDQDWMALDKSDLKRSLETQKSHTGRIRVPAWEEVLRALPANYPVPKNPVRIKWSLVCMGYQPELSIAWSACTRAFGEEAKQDRVFEESLFWVVTRTIHCFY